MRWLLNLYPPYWATGIRVDRIATDWRELDVSMGLHFYNRNYFGSHFGGSLYSMIDPHYVLLLAQVLGPGYRVVDQSARITFIRPGRGRVRAGFRIDDELLDRIDEQTREGAVYRPELTVDVLDEQNRRVARAEKVIYIKRRTLDSD